MCCCVLLLCCVCLSLLFVSWLCPLSLSLCVLSLCLLVASLCVQREGHSYCIIYKFILPIINKLIFFFFSLSLYCNKVRLPHKTLPLCFSAYAYIPLYFSLRKIFYFLSPCVISLHNKGCIENMCAQYKRPAKDVYTFIAHIFSSIYTQALAYVYIPFIYTYI